MNSIDSNNSNSENEINQSKLNEDSNSQFIYSENSNGDNEISYINTYNNGFNNNLNYNFEFKRKRNLIDYLNFNDNEYKKQQTFKKINIMLDEFKNTLNKNIIDEIANSSWYYLKKLGNKKLSTIVPIITYKTIKKYKIKTVSLKDLKQKLNFSYKTYFRNEKLFSELFTNDTGKKLRENYKYNNDINNIITIKKQSFSELVLSSVIKYIDIIKEKYQTKKDILGIKYNNLSKEKKESNYVKANYRIIDSIYNKITQNEKITKELYSNPALIELNNCLMQIKSFIYNNTPILSEKNNYNIKDEIMSDTNMTNFTINLKEENENKIYEQNSFNNFFENKVDADSLALGLLKYFIDKNGLISLSYRKMTDIFKWNIYRIKKSILYIKEYNNLLLADN